MKKEAIDFKTSRDFDISDINIILLLPLDN